MSAIYTCGRCGRAVSKSTRVCPHCGARLAGIKCQNCGFIGSETDFVADRCPKCHSVVHIPTPKYRPSTPKKRYVPGLFVAIVSLVLTFVFPILAGLLCIYVALKAEEKAAKIIGWVGLALNLLILIGIILAGSI